MRLGWLMFMQLSVNCCIRYAIVHLVVQCRGQQCDWLQQLRLMNNRSHVEHYANEAARVVQDLCKSCSASCYFIFYFIANARTALQRMDGQTICKLFGIILHWTPLTKRLHGWKTKAKDHDIHLHPYVPFGLMIQERKSVESLNLIRNFPMRRIIGDTILGQKFECQG